MTDIPECLCSIPANCPTCSARGALSAARFSKTIAQVLQRQVDEARQLTERILQARRHGEAIDVVDAIDALAAHFGLPSIPADAPHLAERRAAIEALKEARAAWVTLYGFQVPLPMTEGAEAVVEALKARRARTDAAEATLSRILGGERKEGPCNPTSS